MVWHAIRSLRGDDPEGRKMRNWDGKASLNARVAQRRKDLGRPDPPPRVDEAVPKMCGAVRIEAFRRGWGGVRQVLAPLALFPSQSYRR